MNKIVSFEIHGEDGLVPNELHLTEETFRKVADGSVELTKLPKAMQDEAVYRHPELRKYLII